MGELLAGEFGIELRLTSRKENGASIAAWNEWFFFLQGLSR